MYKSHYRLAIDSQDHDYSADFQVLLSHDIRFKKGVKYGLRLEKIKIANTFPQVDSRFNTFIIEEDNGATQYTNTVVLSVGSPTIAEAIAEAETQLIANSAASGDTNTYDLDYDGNTQFLTITWSGGSTNITVKSIANGCTFNRGFGFATDDVNDSTGVLVSPNVAVLSGFIPYIKVLSSLFVDNHYTPDQSENTLAQINLDVARSQYILQENTEGFANITQLNPGHSISNFDLSLVDKHNVVLDMRGGSFSFVLVIYEWRNNMR